MFIVGVLLAAGAGSRFGGEKLLASLPGGVPVGVRAARNLRAGVDRGIAVLRPADVHLARLLEKEDFDVAFFAHAADGMGASLAFGVASSAEADGWLIALADMPFVLPATIASLVNRMRDGAWITAPAVHGRRGHPVGFARPLFSDLVQLGGDEGARPLLIRHSSRLETFESEDPGVLSDIDTPSDLQALDKKLLL
jgi:molybdenum cofactor cytidylyltransferase